MPVFPEANQSHAFAESLLFSKAKASRSGKAVAQNRANAASRFHSAKFVPAEVMTGVILP